MTTVFATAPPSGYSIRGAENSESDLSSIYLQLWRGWGIQIDDQILPCIYDTLSVWVCDVLIYDAVYISV